MRIMAIDFGDARVGLAVSDELQMLTGDAWTLTEHNMERAADKIVAEAKARNVGTSANPCGKSLPQMCPTN